VTGRLEGRLIGLGVTGSIAAYKAVELLRLLRAEGADVVAMLTPSAAQFVGPLSFAALTRHPVETGVLDLLPDGRIGHIVIADSADAIVVAPATAHWLGAMAGGLSGDAVTAACLATAAPVVIAPAMDGDMWTHPATQDNVARLRDRFGYVIVDPEIGSLASGQSGVGRLADLPAVVDAVVTALSGHPVRAADPMARPPVVPGPVGDADLEGRHVVVTAGGTREAIDPVRFIGNRSSGRMGVAVATAARERGARVTLIAANMDVPAPDGVEVVRVESTADLRQALLSTLPPDGPGWDVLVMAAAVADFRPAHVADRKLLRGDRLTLDLEPTPDILAEIAARVREGIGEGPSDAADARQGAADARQSAASARRILVGFAAETGSLDRAADKLRRKGVDLLVANDVTEAGSGFGTDTNRVAILAADGSRDDLPLLSKREVADRLLDRVVAALDARAVGAQTAAR
jgi:phosphopantothenoylcysteine decarboxylase/phosphopantothenate--cysteine ligase